LEIKVDGPSGKLFGVRKLDQNNTVERVVEEAMNMIFTEGREARRREDKNCKPHDPLGPFD
jgi:hypothetical protein